MKDCTIFGSKSDIARGLMPYLTLDGWTIHEWHRFTHDSMKPWDLIIIALGRVAPVGMWWENDTYTKGEWAECFYSNLLLPALLLRHAYPLRKPGASVCFMAGSNPNKIMNGYAPYNASKMALLKLCEQMDAETPDIKFFALGPGYVDTKIHKATEEKSWPNERIARGNPTSIDKVWDCLRWCLGQTKEIIGGRNICASDPYGPELVERLKADPSLYKLRRVQ